MSDAVVIPLDVGLAPVGCEVAGTALRDAVRTRAAGSKGQSIRIAGRWFNSHRHRSCVTRRFGSREQPRSPTGPYACLPQWGIGGRSNSEQRISVIDATRAEYDRFGGVGISMAGQPKSPVRSLLPEPSNPGLVTARQRFGFCRHNGPRQALSSACGTRRSSVECMELAAARRPNLNARKRLMVRSLTQLRAGLAQGVFRN